MNSRIRAIALAVVTATAVLMGGLVTTSAVAANAAPAKRKPGTSTGVVCSPDAVTPLATPRARYVWTQLRKAGYSPAASAGVVGLLDAKSGLAPMAISDDNTRFGIAQWPYVRWINHVEAIDAIGANRWGLKRQTDFLIADMATNPVEFDNEPFKLESDPAAAARLFNRTYVPGAVTEESLASAAAKAQEWFTLLSPLPLVELDPALTNGIQVPCDPAGVSLDRCPMVPDTFKKRFAAYTGFSWNNLDKNTQMMSRCVYTNFPHIVSHGTYSGHMPRWQQALDFFMPSGCSTRGSRRFTNSRVDTVVGQRLARYLITNNNKMGVDYVIWHDHIRNPIEHSGEQYWRPVNYWRQDNYNNGDCVNTHFDHVHASTYRSSLAAGLPEPALNPDGKPW